MQSGITIPEATLQHTSTKPEDLSISEIDSVTLDSVLENVSVDVLKIDVEGYETAGYCRCNKDYSKQSSHHPHH